MSMLRHVALGVVLGATGAFLLLTPGGTPSATAQGIAAGKAGEPAGALQSTATHDPSFVTLDSTRAGCPGDLNGDNTVNSTDLGILLANFGHTCSTGGCASAADCTAAPQNTTPTCTASVCSYPCSTGYLDCNATSVDGCEVYVLTDPNNCGACGHICSAPVHGVPACSGGSCFFTCTSGFSNCSGNCVNTATDPANCGTCGHACSVANGVAGCAGGTCTVAQCNSGFANCDNITANGCEINLNSDPANCGGCGHACAVANGTAGCAGGQCTVASCNTPFRNCDNVTTNGCEINTNTDPNNCGNCGVVCALTAHVQTVSCNSGTCFIVSCQTGWFNANGVYADGCETNAP